MQITQPKKKEALEFMMLQIYQHILLNLANKNKKMKTSTNHNYNVLKGELPCFK